MTTDMNGVLIPNNAFDLEYSTQFKREMLYLWNHGFKYTFKKYVPKYGIPIYKYTKTPELFRCIADFYETINTERESHHANIKKTAKQHLKESGDCDGGSN